MLCALMEEPMRMEKLNVGVALSVLMIVAAGCSENAAPTDKPAEAAAPAAPAEPAVAAPPTGDEAKIQSALSAAPEGIAKDAMVMDIAADGTMKELRAGSNGFTCLPDNPGTPGPDPMCADANGMAWMDAYMKKQTPPAGKVGLMYMLAGGTDASNTDPYAAAPTDDNHWIKTGPHVMIMGATTMMEGYPASADPDTSKPYVMWAGTPYAHIMAPVK
ncbi:MAG TPA: hypothetical protein VFV70_02330 [Hyphomonadaceae bacterium]|nr:hypothetical protein [Hyphomonadaceae bacterium]